MRELTDLSQEKIELSVKKQQEIEKVLEGKIVPQPGHFVWEIDLETEKIKQAEYKKTTVSIFGAKKDSEELMKQPNCIYIPALNKKNALKKFKNNKNQEVYYVKEPISNISDLKF